MILSSRGRLSIFAVTTRDLAVLNVMRFYAMAFGGLTAAPAALHS